MAMGGSITENNPGQDPVDTQYQQPVKPLGAPAAMKALVSWSWRRNRASASIWEGNWRL